MSGNCPYFAFSSEPLTERHVQAIWYDRTMRPPHLVTRRGTSVQVVDPGRWNLGAGPDFKDAVLELGPEGRRVAGDVEIHLHPGDWDAHGHGNDPAYRNVIAHVTWGCGPPPASLPAGTVSIWVGRFVTADIGFSPDQIDLTAYPFARLPNTKRPCHARLQSDPDLAQAILRAAGVRRLWLKARRLERLLGTCPPEQLFYAEVMTALGYRRNSAAFREIAATVPLATLVSEPENAAAMLLTASAFADLARGGNRPRNSPAVRLRSAAEIFTTTDIMKLATVSDFSPRNCRDLVKRMSDRHLMGRGRAAAVLCNVILPFSIAEGRILEVPAWLPAEDLSEPVRLTAWRLFGRDHNPRAIYAGNGLYIQGLLQIHREYCLRVHPDCESCELARGRFDKNSAI